MSSTSIYSSGDRTPYTYYIEWSKYNVKYFGRRTAKGCRPAEFWESYFTSSHHVERFRQTYGDPDIISIDQVFDTIDECKFREQLVLEFYSAAKDDTWLNKTNGDMKWDTSGKPSNVAYHKNHAKNNSETRAKIKNTVTELHKSGYYEDTNCYPRSEEQRNLRKDALLGKTGDSHPAFIGYYHTPYGIFSTIREVHEKFNFSKSAVERLCRESTTPLKRITKEIHFASPNIVTGATPKDYGWWFESIRR